jgi:hypothetical protein
MIVRRASTTDSGRDERGPRCVERHTDLRDPSRVTIGPVPGATINSAVEEASQVVTVLNMSRVVGIFSLRV